LIITPASKFLLRHSLPPLAFFPYDNSAVDPFLFPRGELLRILSASIQFQCLFFLLFSLRWIPPPSPLFLIHPRVPSLRDGLGRRRRSLCMSLFFLSFDVRPTLSSPLFLLRPALFLTPPFTLLSRGPRYCLREFCEAPIHFFHFNSYRTKESFPPPPASLSMVLRPP